jgi:hypothetical protein
VTNDGWPDQPLSLFEGEMKRAWGQVIPVSAGGLGCALIYRHVLQVIEFRDRGRGYCDCCFARDVLKTGFWTATREG